VRYVFLDANILLDFYRYGDDDLAEVAKLIALCADGELCQITNKVLRGEVARNREKVLAESFGALKSQKFGFKAPNYCRNMDEYSALKEALKAAGKCHNDLINRVDEAISKNQLEADKLLEELWAKAKELPVDEQVVSKAERRISLRNPPGKQVSLGDAIHWESFLETNIGLYSLDIVSRDEDFQSELRPGKIKSVLEEEWRGGQGSWAELTLFTSLSSFFRERFPQIKLSDEVQKNELIANLSTSPNFATTHALVEELLEFEFFTKGQALRLFSILVENSQVGWIAMDADLNELFTKKLIEHVSDVPDSVAREAALALDVDYEEFFQPLPF